MVNMEFDKIAHGRLQWDGPPNNFARDLVWLSLCAIFTNSMLVVFKVVVKIIFS